MSTNPLLIELLTEELPPKALQKLGKAFAQGIYQSLDKQHLLGEQCKFESFATPRRLAVRLSQVLAQAPEQAFAEKLMPVKIGLDENGHASAALQKKLASKGLEHLSVADLNRESDGKQEYLIAKGTAPGTQLAAFLQTAIDEAIAGLPIPKVMRYQLADGQTSVRFVRPVHGLVILFGDQVLPVSVLGISSSHVTRGHRFLSKAPIQLNNANTYEQQLRDEGKVVASYEERRDMISTLLASQAATLGATIGNDPEVTALLDEVTSLVEYPAVYIGQFEEKFLAVPPECLILTMRLNQKYFPLFDPATGKLTHHFLIVSNMDIEHPQQIIEGNERVVRPRLADAEFFFNTDRKMPLAARVEQLATIVYHNKLGTQLDRSERVRKIAAYIAQQLNANVALADRAALLAKADLGSNMVGEFPELQGIIGAYYAKADGEPEEIVTALAEQYRVRYDKPVSQETLTSAILFIAERTETLIGIWGIGLVPTGERDPYALRRAALGLISAVEQLAAGHFLNLQTQLSLNELLEFAAGTFEKISLNPNTVAEVQAFIYERYRNQLNGDYDRSVVDAVIALTPPLHEIVDRVKAVTAFAQLPEADSLAAANKRIANLLKKVDGSLPAINAEILLEPAEKALADTIEQIQPVALDHFGKGKFEASLSSIASTREAVDAFFTDVMVMAEDPAIRNNRLALLSRLHGAMNLVADISRLAK
ncbi:glycine--tRNA ligase subunit beta [Advenella sp. WQ 585]|uniref:Glycine--tRNA ligase beta subunit n=1 Tax=Advenella mandrilli TaxID=2800330 RepID=A0ABS1E9W3_9BURK|nr:glycine--tRNA ligase subunit beta [Advenella mandrilli]MBK1780261.1 glycine--tRNA ligase subunit beta [Advenella mandrilli]